MAAKKSYIWDGSAWQQISSTTADLSTYLGKYVTINAQIGTSYTLILADDSKIVEMNNAATNTLTVPANSTVPYSVGTQITILQTGTGQTTITGAAGVTVNSTPGSKLRTQWSSATLIKRATDTWVLLGDLTT
jgi:hypothetical protein